MLVLPVAHRLVGSLILGAVVTSRSCASLGARAAPRAARCAADAAALRLVRG